MGRSGRAAHRRSWPQKKTSTIGESTPAAVEVTPFDHRLVDDCCDWLEREPESLPVPHAILPAHAEHFRANLQFALSESQAVPSMSEPSVRPDRRLLFINFDFPPRRTSGVYRMRGLVKYLAATWDVTVLTVRGPVLVWSTAELTEDPRLMEGLPADLRIVRTNYLDLRAWERIHPAHGRAKGPSEKAASEGTPESVARNEGAGAKSNAAKRSFRIRVLRAVAAWLRATVYFPDPTSGWIPYAVSAARRLHREEPFDLVFTSSPPRSSLLVGLMFKLWSGRPWVAEFMDPWYPPSGPLRARAERWLQGMVLRHADAVVVMTDLHAAYLRKKYPRASAKITVIPNGYDEEDFATLKAEAPSVGGKIDLLHVGTIYPGHAGQFFRALSELIAESPEIQQQLSITILGSPDQETIDNASRAPGNRVIKLLGYREHQETLEAMSRADYLLLFLAEREWAQLCISSKIYEYLRVGRPIIAVTYEGGVATLVAQSNAGVVLPPDDIPAIKRALRSLVTRSADIRGATPEFAAQFRYDQLATSMNGVFQELLAGRSKMLEERSAS